MSLLNTTIRIGNMELNNRLVMPPMAISKADRDGKATENTFAYYDEKSKGGYIGLIIAEHCYISQEGKASNGQLSIADDSSIEGLNKIVSIVHGNGSRIMAQLNHAGSATTETITGFSQMSASAIKMPEGSLTAPRDKNVPPPPKEMSIFDIEKVIDEFSSAALRAKKSGFDGVEIHSAHGYLLNQFYSPLTNKRNDEYTGSTIHGRIRLHVEIIRAIREKVGAEYPIALRLGACDYMRGGTSIEDSIAAVKEFEKAGLDLIDISGGFCGYINPYCKEQGYFSEISKAIKHNVTIPVILTGGITEKNTAEILLKDEKADLIGVGRAILKNSEWAKKNIAN